MGCLVIRQGMSDVGYTSADRRSAILGHAGMMRSVRWLVLRGIVQMLAAEEGSDHHRSSVWQAIVWRAVPR